MFEFVCFTYVLKYSFRDVSMQIDTGGFEFKIILSACVNVGLE